MSIKLRNAKCECGSDKKYKRCCWHEDNTEKGITIKGARVALKDMRYQLKRIFKETGVCPTKETLLEMVGIKPQK